jgi:hypothetical protein
VYVCVFNDDRKDDDDHRDPSNVHGFISNGYGFLNVLHLLFTGPLSMLRTIVRTAVLFA